jgi:hypothetical protein
MTTVSPPRSASAYVQQASTTKKSGANPSTLTVSSVAAKNVYTYLAFGVPTEPLLPTSNITGAKLTIYTAAAWAAQTVEVRRLTAAFTASSVTWATKPTSDNGIIASVATGALAKNAKIEFNVLAILQAMQADSSRNFGFEVRFNGGSHTYTLANSGAFVAVLSIDYTTQPATPTALSPADDQVVSVPKPTLRVVSAQTTGQALNAINVQVSPTHNPVGSFDYTRTDVPTEVDLSIAPGAPTLAAHGASAWRARVRGFGNVWSNWSDWADYTYEPFGTLTILEPDVTPNDVVTDPSPPIIWSVSGMTQTAFRVFFTDPSLPAGSDVIFDSGIIMGAATTYTPTQSVATVSGHQYKVIVRVWDDKARVVNGGATEFVQTERLFTFVLTATVDPFTGVAVVDMAPLPFVELVGTRSTPPDGVQIIRDGVSVGVFDAADLHVSGDDYAFIDTLADPRREHTWLMRAIVNGEVSATNTLVTEEINPAGIWLSQPEKDRYLPFITQSSQAIGVTEDGGTFQILNGNYAVRVFGTQHGWAGTIVGEILATELSGDTTGAGLFDLFMLMRADQGDPAILSLLDMAIKVVPFNMTIAPTPTPGKNGDYVYAASLEFIEAP